ncbi:MAG: hypothetical protein VX346_24685 [Planctomycetota bacterium]|nr:hypothetical protein [Planctomycetota bacterium]
MTRPPVDDRRRGLPKPQFGLVFLFLAVSLVGGIFAATRYFGAYGGFAALLGLLCVAAHVIGNAWGTQLRQSGNFPVDEDGIPIPAAGRQEKPLGPGDFAPITRLSRRRALGISVTVATVTGILVGISFATYFFFTSESTETTWEDFGVAILGFGILGGVWAFLGTSFLYVTWGAIRQATQESVK